MDVKVKSWKILMTVVVSCSIILINAFLRIREGEFVGYAWCIIGILYLIEYLPIAFSEEKCEEQQRIAHSITRICRKKFGRLAPVMEWGGIILLVLSGVCAYFWPDMAFALFIAAALYIVWFRYMIGATRKNEEGS